MTAQVAQRTPVHLSKPLSSLTSTKQNQKISQANKSEFKDFTDLQVKVTRKAIENIRETIAKLNQDIFTGSSQDKKSHKMIINVKCLNKPYKTGSPSIEDLPESFHKTFDPRKYEIKFATPHAMAEAVNLTFNDAKGEFPELTELQKEVAQLKQKPHEDKLYGLIVGGVKHAFFPPTKDPQKLAAFESLKTKELLKDLIALEDQELDESTLIKKSRIISKQVLKLTHEYADSALKNFPEALGPQSKENWTLSKVEAVAKAQV